jgi:hypothetical protein
MSVNADIKAEGEFIRLVSSLIQSEMVEKSPGRLYNSYLLSSNMIATCSSLT